MTLQLETGSLFNKLWDFRVLVLGFRALLNLSKQKRDAEQNFNNLHSNTEGKSTGVLMRNKINFSKFSIG